MEKVPNQNQTKTKPDEDQLKINLEVLLKDNNTREDHEADNRSNEELVENDEEEDDESEDKSWKKERNIEGILNLQRELIKNMWQNAKSGLQKEKWLAVSDRDMKELTRALHTASQKYYVTHKSLKEYSRQNRTNDDAWQFTSALMFAFTTMATIGYGNIVPVTPRGRLFCIFFALFGTPLAIITIADLGKFLSECTICLYRAICRLKHKLKNWRREVIYSSRMSRASLFLRLRNPKEDQEGNNNASAIDEAKLDELDDLTQTEVPVLVVFAMLICYVGLGAVLFSLMEGWPLHDSFYFSFITLTTVGFGDLVPRNHIYIVVMIVYMGVGLAITTMCIDLVGVHYIEKIHFFGRKFKGAHLMRLLRRRKQLEKTLALVQQRQIMADWLLNAQTNISQSPSEKQSTPSTVQQEESPPPIPVVPTWPVFQRQVSESAVTSSLSMASSLSTSASVYERARLYAACRRRSKTSWSASGPSIFSNHCSLSTTPSVAERERMYGKLPPSPCWSESQDFLVVWRPPSRNSPRGMAAMELWESFKELEMLSLVAHIRVPEIELAEPMEEMEEPVNDLELSVNMPLELELETEASPVFSELSTPSEPVPLEFGEAIEFHDSGSSTLGAAETNEPVVYHRNLPVYSVVSEAIDSESAITNALQCPVKCLSSETPHNVTENYCFVVDGDKVRLEDVLEDNEMWKLTSRPTKYYFSEDLRSFKKVQMISSKGKQLSARLFHGQKERHFNSASANTNARSLKLTSAVSTPDLSTAGQCLAHSSFSPSSPQHKMLLPPPIQPTVAALASSSGTGNCAITINTAVISSIKLGGGAEKPQKSACFPPPQQQQPQPRQATRRPYDEVPLQKVYKVTRYYSYWKTCVAFHRIVTVISPLQTNGSSSFKRIFVQYLWREATEADKLRVSLEFNPVRQRIRAPSVCSPRELSASARTSPSNSITPGSSSYARTVLSRWK